MIGDEVVATGKITSLDPEKGRAVLAMQATVNGKSVLDGEARRRCAAAAHSALK